jgi:hypothetical protein
MIFTRPTISVDLLQVYDPVKPRATGVFDSQEHQEYCATETASDCLLFCSNARQKAEDPVKTIPQFRDTYSREQEGYCQSYVRKLCVRVNTFKRELLSC